MLSEEDEETGLEEPRAGTSYERDDPHGSFADEDEDDSKGAQNHRRNKARREEVMGKKSVKKEMFKRSKQHRPGRGDEQWSR